MPVLAAEHQARPRGAAFLVLGPLHLVEHERLAVHRRHLRGAADDRRVLVDALLAGDEADAFVAELGREPAVRLLREHAQRRRVHAAAGLDEESQRVVRLPRVRRPEVRDDGSPARSCGAAGGRSARRPACAGAAGARTAGSGTVVSGAGRPRRHGSYEAGLARVRRATSSASSRSVFGSSTARSSGVTPTCAMLSPSGVK